MCTPQATADLRDRLRLGCSVNRSRACEAHCTIPAPAGQRPRHPWTGRPQLLLAVPASTMSVQCEHAPELLGLKRKACAYATAPTPASAPMAAPAAVRFPKLSPGRKRHCNSAQAAERPALANRLHEKAGLLCAESLPDADAGCAADVCSPSGGSEHAASCSFYTGSGELPGAGGAPAAFLHSIFHCHVTCKCMEFCITARHGMRWGGTSTQVPSLLAGVACQL